MCSKLTSRRQSNASKQRKCLERMRIAFEQPACRLVFAGYEKLNLFLSYSSGKTITISSYRFYANTEQSLQFFTFLGSQRIKRSRRKYILYYRISLSHVDFSTGTQNSTYGIRSPFCMLYNLISDVTVLQFCVVMVWFWCWCWCWWWRTQISVSVVTRLSIIFHSCFVVVR